MQSDQNDNVAQQLRELPERIPYEVLRYIPEESATHYKVTPIAFADGALEIGMVDPDDIEATDALNFIARATGIPFKIFKISQADFDRALEMYRGLVGDVEKAVTDMGTEKKNAASEITDEMGPLDLDATVPRQDDDSHKLHDDAPAIKIVSTILRYAIDGKASDVHIEPQNSGVRVRYRVDGELHTSVILPMSSHRAIIARVKVLASIRLDESRKPQDGRFSATIEGRAIDFRVSTFPSYNGEKVVIRILDRGQGYIPLDKIGLSDRNLQALRRAIARPYGLILISGPTGSGKSTTLYSLLTEVDCERKNVLSLEDPVEYYIDGVNQSQVRPEIGYTFANGLRTTLRQDPDVIMVGEIRDGETAKLAFQAALTGHLVLSTIHTNDSVGTISRLVDMGVEPYLIPPVLAVSVAQRLARTLSGSGKPVPLSPSARAAIEEDLKAVKPEYRFEIKDTVYEPQPSASSPTGMRGRMAAFEVLEMSSALEEVILKEPVESKLWAVARAQGVLTIKEDAIIKAFEGKIPFSEVNSLAGLQLQGDEQNV